MAFAQLTPYRRGPISQPSGGFGTGSLLFDLQRQMNRLFEDVFGDEPAAKMGGLGFPLVDISQDDKKIEICAELPGVKQDDIEVNVEDGVLTLTGEKKSSRQDEQTGYSERSYGRFERRITLPSNVDEEHCQADFRDGVLTITIPRAEEKRRGHRIPLGASSRHEGSRPEDALIEPKGREAAGGQQQAASAGQSGAGGQGSTAQSGEEARSKAQKRM